MNDVVRMEVLESKDEARNKKLALRFRKAPTFANVVSKISTVEIVHNEV